MIVTTFLVAKLNGIASSAVIMKIKARYQVLLFENCQAHLNLTDLNNNNTALMLRILENR